MTGEVRDLTVMGDGTVIRKVTDMESQRVATTKHRLLPPQLRVLIRAVQTQRFFALPSSYPLRQDDCPSFVLGVTAAGRSHRVDFPPCERTEWSARRFKRLWETIIQIATPGDYKRSNQEMERTADRCASHEMTSAHSLGAARAVVR